MKILVTGSGGFVGKRFMHYNKGTYDMVPVSLRTTKPKDIDLRGVDSIVHLAVVAHDQSKVNDNIQYAVNYDLTKELADLAKNAGVKQFIFLSSVKVYGDKSKGTLDENSACHPTDAYGKSKWMAEQYLKSIQSDDFQVAIIRPPLVYGPDVKGNMFRMLKLAAGNLPLPLGNVNNQRSMVYVDNLIEMINTVLDQHSSGLFIAGDSRPLSTSELMSMIKLSMTKDNSLLPVPGFVQKILMTIFPEICGRLFGSFVIDPKNSNKLLGFSPPYSIEYGVNQMVRWYIRSNPQ